MRWIIICLQLYLCLSISELGTRTLGDEPAESTSRPPTRTAVIVAGLPGDEFHAKRFREQTDAWRQWLSAAAGFPADQIHLFTGSSQDGATLLATRASLQELLVKLGATLRKQDALWLFVVGHANYDGSRAWLHLSGPDPDAAMLGQWLRDIKCSEQVIWLTQSCAGWFIKPLARPGRIVISATAPDFEFNDTEFPSALTTTIARSRDELDRDHDQRISVLELFASAVAETTVRFQADQRIPTESAQLDDDGDGEGSTWEEIERAATSRPGADPAAKSAVKVRNIDGGTAAKTLLPPPGATG